MGVLASINRFIGLIIDVLGQVGRWKIWLILGAYLLIQWLILYSHYQFTLPLFHGCIDFWTRLWNEQLAVKFSHYPGHYLLMPYFFGWAKFFVGLIIEGLVLGLVARRFWTVFAESDEFGLKPVRITSITWMQLVGGWLVINGLILAIGNYLPGLVDPLLDQAPRRILAFELLVLPVIDLVLFALLIHLIPAIAIRGDNLLEAVSRSARMFLAAPLLTFLLAAAVLTGPILISLASSRSARIIEKFNPELVYWLLLVGLAIEMPANFIWMGSTVKRLAEE